jgi:hypothetical protein
MMKLPSSLSSLLVICLLTAVALTGGVAVADTVSQPNTGASSNTTGDSQQISGGEPVIVESANTSNYLSPSVANISTETYSQPTLDVGSAVQSDSLRLQGEHKEREIRELFTGDASDVTEEAVVEELEADLRALEAQYKTLFQQHSNGDVEPSTLFREFVRLGVTGEQYQQVTETAESVSTPTSSVDLRFRNLRAEIGMYSSPVVSHLDSELRTGESEPMYIQGGDDSLVLGTVVGDTYLREAIMFSQRDRNATEQFGSETRSNVQDAFDRARMLYPWALEAGTQSEIQGFGDSSVYRIEASHAHGELRSYLDGGTTSPFVEIQEKNPFAVSASDFTQQTGNGVRLSVESTDPTGPMRIDVVETEETTGNITISIDGAPLETIGESQTIWTVQPRGSFEVTAETEAGETVTVVVFP